MNLYDSRLNFQIRSKMLDVKFNFSAKHEHELWECDSCCSSIETQSHLLYCPAYASLREGKDIKNDEHLISYIREVMNVRTKLNLRKWEKERFKKCMTNGGHMEWLRWLPPCEGWGEPRDLDGMMRGQFSEEYCYHDLCLLLNVLYK